MNKTFIHIIYNSNIYLFMIYVSNTTPKHYVNQLTITLVSDPVSFKWNHLTQIYWSYSRFKNPSYGCLILKRQNYYTIIRLVSIRRQSQHNSLDMLEDKLLVYQPPTPSTELRGRVGERQETLAIFWTIFNLRITTISILT